MNHRSAWIVGAFALLCVLFTGQFPPFRSPNELSRLETVYAFVENGTFAIDRAIPVLGDHEDKAASGGRFYSNKAPGLALVAIPVYRVLRIFFVRPRSADATVFILLRLLVVSSICTIGLARLARRLSLTGTHLGPVVAAASAFGTPYLFYARSFLSHAWTAALLFLSWDLLRLAREREVHRRVGASLVASGLLAGWAVISEYPVALLVLSLAVLAFRDRSWRRLWLFCLGAFLPVAVLMAYDAICFGSPFALSSSRESLPEYAALAGRGLFGFGWPSPAIAWAYLAHPARGLLLFSPFLLWVLWGFAAWWRSGIDRADATFAAAATGLYFVTLCAYPNWHGGWALGNRYLLPVLFLAVAAIPHALASRFSRGVFIAASAFSIGVHALACATWPYFPLNVPWPPASGSAWFLSRGWVAPGLGPSWLRLAVALAIPIAALVWALRESTSGPRREIVPLLAGILLFTVTLVRHPDLAYGGRLWRAAVFGRFSGLDPERVELRRVMAEAATPSERKRAADAWRLFGK